MLKLAHCIYPPYHPYKERPIVKQEVSVDDKKMTCRQRICEHLKSKMPTIHLMCSALTHRYLYYLPTSFFIVAMRSATLFALALFCILNVVRLNAIACDRDQVTVHIVLSQFGATVWVDGERRGNAPLKPLCLQGGLHVIKLVRPSRPGRSAKQVSRLVWVPHHGSWSVDLSTIRLESDPSEVVEIGEIKPRLSRSSSESSQTSSSSSRVRQRRPLSDLSPPTQLTLRGEISNLGSTQDPTHDTLLSAYELILGHHDADYSDPGLRFGVHMISRQDLWVGDLPLHHATPWTRDQSRISARESWLGWRMNSSGTLQIQGGRLRDHIGRRQLVMDGLSAQTRWGTLTKSWSAKMSVGRGAETIVDQMISTSSPHLAPARLMISTRGDISDGAQSATLSLDALLPLSHDGALGRDQDEVSPWFTPPKLRSPHHLWAISSRLQHQDFKLDGHVSLNLSSDNAHGSHESKQKTETLSHELTPLSAWSLSLSWGENGPKPSGEAQKQSRTWSVQGEISQRAGDYWDQVALPGVVWSDAHQAPVTLAHVNSVWRRLSLHFDMRRGVAPLWRGADGHRREGSVYRYRIAWNDLNDDRQGSLATESSTQGLTLAATLWDTQRGARRWGINPWAEREVLSSRIQSALGVGWRHRWRLSSDAAPNADLRFEVMGYLDPIKLSTHDQSSMKSDDALDIDLVWAEGLITYQEDRLKLSAHCGRPLNLPQMITRNMWLVRCGLRLTIDAPVTF